MSRTRVAIVGVAALVILTTTPVAIVAQGDPIGETPRASEGSSLTWCGDMEQIYAPPDAYRDSPIYVANE